MFWLEVIPDWVWVYCAEFWKFDILKFIIVEIIEGKINFTRENKS